MENEHRTPISFRSPVTKFYRDSNKKKTFAKRTILAKMAADKLEHVPVKSDFFISKRLKRELFSRNFLKQ